MEFIIISTDLVQSIAISLGLGCSTLAVVNFFVAIADGKIDETERKMMGVVYTLLRLVLAVITISTIIIVGYNISEGGITAFTAYSAAQVTLIGVLYLNSLLMTLKLMSSTFGPAIQAGSWYTLGIIAALVPVGLDRFTYPQFLLGYLTVLILAIAIINGIMGLLKEIKRRKLETGA